LAFAITLTLTLFCPVSSVPGKMAHASASAKSGKQLSQRADVERLLEDELSQVQFCSKGLSSSIVKEESAAASGLRKKGAAALEKANNILKEAQNTQGWTGKKSLDSWRKQFDFYAGIFDDDKTELWLEVDSSNLGTSKRRLSLSSHGSGVSAISELEHFPSPPLGLKPENGDDPDSWLEVSSNVPNISLDPPTF
jgi:hypothetical protein